MLIPQPFPRWIDAKRTHSPSPQRRTYSCPTHQGQEGSLPVERPEELARIEEAAGKLVAALLPKTARLIREHGTRKVTP